MTFNVLQADAGMFGFGLKKNKAASLEGGGSKASEGEVSHLEEGPALLITSLGDRSKKGRSSGWTFWKVHVR